MSGETKRAERTGTNEQRDKAGGTAERTDKRTNGRMDEQTERTEWTEQMDRRRNSRTNGQTGGWTSEQSRTEQTEQTEQDEQAEKRSRQTADTSHRHSEDSQNTRLNHVAGEKKRQSAPEKPDGSGNREQIGRKWRPGADRTKADRPKRRCGISGRLFRYVRRH